MKHELEEAFQGALEIREKPPYTPERRLFLEWMSVGVVGAVGSLILIPIIGVVFSPLLKAPPGVWRDVGPIDKYLVGDTVLVSFRNPSPMPWAGYEAKNAVWLRRDTARRFTALSIFCQHMGCPVRWEPVAGMFFCPCHGGVYYANGEVAAGPPPRPLKRYPTRVRRNRIEVFTGSIPVPF